MNGKRPGGWVALAWRYYRDERLLAVSADAELLWTHALAFTGEQATDGRVPAAALGLLATKLVGSPEAAAVELVGAGLWAEACSGWTFAASWERWQPTAEQARAGRERATKRKALSRAFGDRTEDRPGESRSVGEGEGGVRSTSTPSPQRETIDASQDQEPATWVDEHGYLFVGRPPEDNGAAS